MNNSIKKILNNTNINRLGAFIRYSLWQVIKFMNLFPRRIKVSNSHINIIDKAAANQGGGLMFTHRLYDYNNMKLILDISGFDRLSYFDIGANKGIYSLLVSENTTNSVYSFEPHPITYRYLLDNISLNKRTNINTFNFALGTSNDKLRFTDVAGSSTNMIVSDSEKKSIEVDVVALNSFVQEHNVIPTHIKIDVEGFEYEVLKGSLNFLKEVKLLQIEISKNYDEIVKVLHENVFLGPYYYQHKFKTMHSNKFSGCEDPLFINSGYKSTLENNLNIKFEG